MNFTKYEKYKDSGLDWFGEIPEDWKVKRFKDEVRSNCKSLSDKTNEDYQIEYIDISSVSSGGVVNQTEKMSFKESPSRARRIVRKNDVIVSTVRTYLKAVAFFETANENLICSTGFSVLSPLKTIYPTFLKYIALSEIFIERVVCSSKGVSYPAINNSELIDLELVLPNIKLQTTISNYLDEQTAKIDRKIELLQAKKEKYQELRKTLINETVTKGLDKTVELKDSGVEWLGQIPKHWEVKRIKDIGSVNARVGWKALKASEYVDKSEYFFLATPNIKYKEIDFVNVNYLTKARYNESPEIMLKLDDILLAKDGSTLGIVNIVKYLPSKVTVNSSIAVLRFNKYYFNNYIFYQIKSDYLQNVINLKKDGAGVPHLFQKDINNFVIISPPIEEQKQIAKYLDEKTGTIDAIITAIDKNIATLNEFRKTLINDAVTGQIAVSS